MRRPPHRRYDHPTMHRLLADAALSDTYRRGQPPSRDLPQAYTCPHYVPLQGRLGADWGVIVNPESTRFAQLTFEHDWCGCPIPDGTEPLAAHAGAANQDGDTWDIEWEHRHGEFCPEHCPWPEAEP